MRWFRFAALVLIATILQTSLIDIIAFSAADIKPNLLLILLVFFAVHCKSTDAIITSFTIGFAADIVSSTMGPQIISFGLFGTLLAELHYCLTIRKRLYQSLAIFITGLLAAALTYFLTFFKAEPVASNTYTELFWTPLYSAIVGPFLFLPTQWWMHTKTNRRWRSSR